MKIKIKKLRELPDEMHPHNIEVGFEKTIDLGDRIIPKPNIGDRFPTHFLTWSTSPVREIINENTFKTLNYIYHWEVVEEKKENGRGIRKGMGEKEKTIDHEINKGIWFGEGKKEPAEQ